MSARGGGCEGLISRPHGGKTQAQRPFCCKWRLVSGWGRASVDSRPSEGLGRRSGPRAGGCARGRPAGQATAGARSPPACRSAVLEEGAGPCRSSHVAPRSRPGNLPDSTARQALSSPGAQDPSLGRAPQCPDCSPSPQQLSPESRHLPPLCPTANTFWGCTWGPQTLKGCGHSAKSDGSSTDLVGDCSLGRGAAPLRGLLPPPPQPPPPASSPGHRPAAAHSRCTRGVCRLRGQRDEAGNPACGCYCGSPTPGGCVRALAPPNPYAGPERTLEGPDTDPPAPRGRAAPARTATSRLLPRTAEPLPVRPGPAPASRNRPLEGSPLPCPQGRAPPPRPCRHSEHHPLTHPLRPQERSWLCGDVLGSPQETH